MHAAWLDSEVPVLNVLNSLSWSVLNAGNGREGPSAGYSQPYVALLCLGPSFWSACGMHGPRRALGQSRELAVCSLSSRWGSQVCNDHVYTTPRHLLKEGFGLRVLPPPPPLPPSTLESGKFGEFYCYYYVVCVVFFMSAPFVSHHFVVSLMSLDVCVCVSAMSDCFGFYGSERGVWFLRQMIWGPWRLGLFWGTVRNLWYASWPKSWLIRFRLGPDYASQTLAQPSETM